MIHRNQIFKSEEEKIMKKTLTMISVVIFSIAVLYGTVSARENVSAGQTIRLSTINWEPYTGESLPDHGFFSELVTEALARAGYRVEFQYRPWKRALHEAKKGDVHGLMDAYWKKDRVGFLDYPDVVWKVREEFIALRDNPVKYSGKLGDLKDVVIGSLRGSAQDEELRAAGIRTDVVTDQRQNVEKLLKGRIDAMLIPNSIFFYHAEQLDPRFDRTRVKILTPPYKIYDMYVVFSKKKPGYAKLTADFNRGLKLIKTDGTYQKILEKHHIMPEE